MYFDVYFAIITNHLCTYIVSLGWFGKHKFHSFSDFVHVLCLLTGREDDTNDSLKSLMVIYLFCYIIKHCDCDVDFSKHLYQPELCNLTGEFSHVREDHNHVLKCIRECFWSGSIPGVHKSVLLQRCPS